MGALLAIKVGEGALFLTIHEEAPTFLSKQKITNKNLECQHEYIYHFVSYIFLQAIHFAEHLFHSRQDILLM